MFVFGLSGAMTGVAGCVYAIYLGALSADDSFTLTLSITLITGLVIGGVATTIGPVLGGLAVLFIPYWTENFKQGETSGLFFGVILIVLMFVMPEGLVGLTRRLSARVLRIDPRPPRPPTTRSRKVPLSTDDTDGPRRTSLTPADPGSPR
jgi:branched-chain amino acid transport system permease protein